MVYICAVQGRPCKKHTQKTKMMKKKHPHAQWGRLILRWSGLLCFVLLFLPESLRAYHSESIPFVSDSLNAVAQQPQQITANGNGNATVYPEHSRDEIAPHSVPDPNPVKIYVNGAVIVDPGGLMSNAEIVYTAPEDKSTPTIATPEKPVFKEVKTKVFTKNAPARNYIRDTSSKESINALHGSKKAACDLQYSKKIAFREKLTVGAVSYTAEPDAMLYQPAVLPDPEVGQRNARAPPFNSSFL